MADKWYFTNDGVETPGPYTREQLQEIADSGYLRPDAKVWREGMPDWVDARQVDGLLPASLPPPPPRVFDRGPAPRQDVSGTKLAAGLCGILIGTLGIHKFILGMTTPGLIMLLVTILTCGIGGVVMWVIGLIEGIIYLTKSDEEFYEIYVIGKKEWF